MKKSEILKALISINKKLDIYSMSDIIVKQKIENLIKKLNKPK